MSIMDRMLIECTECGAARKKTDMAWIGKSPYCHPVMSVDPTCYMKEVAGVNK